MVSVGICGSDLLSYSTPTRYEVQTQNGLILGHEFVAADESGTLYAVDPAIPCGVCSYCLQGNQNLCPEVIFAGHDRQDGALREWISWPTHCLIPLPASLSPAEGVMLEPLGIALHSLHLAHFKLGMNVGIFGCGPIGLLLVQLFRLAGASEIFATDVLPHRLDAAKAFGATQTFLAGDEPLLHSQVDVAFDCSGSHGAVRDAVHAARPGSKVLLIGIPEIDQTEFEASVARRKGLSLILVRRMNHTYPKALELVVQHKLDLNGIVSHRFPFENTPQAFETASRRQGLKVIIDF